MYCRAGRQSRPASPSGSFSRLAVPCMMRMLALVRNQPVDVRPLCGQPFASVARAASSSTPMASLKTGLPIHLQQRVAKHPCRPKPCRGHTGCPRACHRAWQVAGEDAGCVSEASSTTAPAPSPNKHAGGPVLEIQDAREHLGADDQRFGGRPRLDHGVGNGQRIDESHCRPLERRRRHSPRCPACSGGCRRQEGNTMSGVEVATMMRSMSAAATPGGFERPTGRR